MEMLVEKMLGDFERGALSRRQLALHLAALATGVAAAGGAKAATPGLKAISLNHVTLKVPDLQKTSKFYQEFFGMTLAQQSKTIHILSVGDGFFGLEEKPGAPGLDHYDFGIEGWDAAAMRAKVAAHGLQLTPGGARRRRVLQVHRPRRLRGPGQWPEIYRPCRAVIGLPRQLPEQSTPSQGAGNPAHRK